MQPKTKYAKSGDVNIAYQVFGEGPIDLVFIPGFISHVELFWEEPAAAHFFSRLASFARVINFDKRGTGLSDPVTGVPTLEQRMDDVRAVMDAAGSERAAIFSVSEGGPMSVLFSATYPDRASALIMYGTMVKGTGNEEYPWAPSFEDWELFWRAIEEAWGEAATLPLLAPNYANDEHFQRYWARFERQSASPAMARSVLAMAADTDVRHVLPAIQAPTLVIHREGDKMTPVQGGRYMAEQIPDAKYVELPGDDHAFFVGDTDAILDEVEEFLTGVRKGPELDRVLATVMFTDIVGSTERAAELGDSRWRELLATHEDLVRRELARFRGMEVKTMGDGFLATFDGPGRAINCARTVSEEVCRLGVQIRAGLHTGECEVMNGDVGGIAVHIGARVAAKAGPGEVLVSSTVKDLVAGSGISFADRGEHALKGVPGDWHLFAVEA